MVFRASFLSFTNGEIGESLEARSNLDLYAAGLKRCTNFMPLPTGPLQFRPGWAKLAQQGTARKIVPFVFSISQVFLFVFGDGKLNVYRCSDHTLVASNITVPWTDGQLPNLRWTASGDTWLGFHPDVVPTKIVRTGSDSSWTVTSFEDYPYARFTDAGLITITPSGTTGSITLTASASLFTAAHATDQCEIQINEGLVEITAYTDPTTVTATVIETLTSISADETWKEQAWSNRRGWPITGCFHQNRLIIAGAKSLPQTIWGSVSASYFNFDASGVDADDSFTFTLNSGSVETISDVYSVKPLHILTSSGEWVETSMPITPSEVQFFRQSPHGSLPSGVRCFGIDSAVLFVDRTNRLRAVSYDYSSDAYVAKNLSVLTPSMLSGPTASAYLRGFGEGNLAMFCNTDGTISTVTVDFEQRVNGWARMVPPTGASFTDLCVVDDEAYALMSWNAHIWIVKLTSNKYLDLCQSSTDTAKTTWTGFTHFASQTVTVVGDGVVYRDVAVTAGGQFTLPDAVASVDVGLIYTGLAETLPLAPVINGQLKRGDRLRKVHCDVMLRNTASLHVDGRRVELRRLHGDLLDAPIAEIDATKRVYLAGIGPEPTVVIEQRDPLPCTLLGVIVDFKTGLAQ